MSKRTHSFSFIPVQKGIGVSEGARAMQNLAMIRSNRERDARQAELDKTKLEYSKLDSAARLETQRANTALSKERLEEARETRLYTQGQREQTAKDLEAAKAAEYDALISPSMYQSQDVFGDVTTTETKNVDEVSAADGLNISKIYDEGFAKIKGNTPEDLKFAETYRSYSNPDSTDFIKDPIERRTAELNLADSAGIKGNDFSKWQNIPALATAISNPISAKINAGLDVVSDFLTGASDREKNENAKKRASTRSSGDYAFTPISQFEAINEKLKNIKNVKDTRISSTKKLDKRIADLTKKATKQVESKISTTKKGIYSSKDFTKTTEDARQKAIKLIVESDVPRATQLAKLKKVQARYNKDQDRYAKAQNKQAERAEQVYQDKRKTGVDLAKKLNALSVKQQGEEFERLRKKRNPTKEEILTLDILRKNLALKTKELDD